MQEKTIRESVSDFLSEFSRGDIRIGELLSYSVGRILLKAARRGQNWRAIGTIYDIPHIVDWLTSAVLNHEAWLEKTDCRNRPLKLMKFSTLDQVVQEADKAMLIASQSLTGVKLSEGDEELYAALGDGYCLVRLFTPAALDRESARMQHCIGAGAYDKHLQRNDVIFLSLRDQYGKPHATYFFRGTQLIEFQGKQNRMPLKKYSDKVIPFLKENRFRSDLHPGHLGHVIDSDGIWHPLDKLPTGLSVRGRLSLNTLDIHALPDGLKVGGYLDLTGTNITSLPEGLEVGGTIALTGTRITALPKGMKVGGYLDLKNTLITELPDDLVVEKDIILSGTQISELPEGIRIGRDIFILKTSIKKFPDSIDGGNFVHCDKGKFSLAKFRDVRDYENYLYSLEKHNKLF